MPRATPLKPLSELKPRRNGFRIEVEDQDSFGKKGYYRLKLSLALKDVDRMRNAWGRKVQIVDVAKGQTLYTYHHLGNPK